MQERVFRTVVIGSGCAGLNAADWLAALGEKSFALVTEAMHAGTSRNTGSDKQTYYRLSLSGDEGDSVGEMARTLAREDVDGDLALSEAAGSAPCFLRLAGLGVPFPTNEYGEYVGYRTDHDTRLRASSAGPLTSRYMTEALERAVRRRNVPILDHLLACRIETDADGIRGVLCLNTERREWELIRCAHVILCTGGPAHVYFRRVYPESQHGMSSLGLEAGAEGANLHCWQYGLASTAFQWNVSGSYQQVIPRYVSVGPDGEQREFLLDTLSPAEAIALVFLKGYEWPYDERKKQGSSRIDLLVKAENDRGRRVFLDYRRNPTGWGPENLTREAREYLENCGAMQATPLERLRAMNAPAVALYAEHGIDLCREMLEISVCAQHHNGGLAVDAWWRTTVPGLYACGEAAGTFGRYRPGGTALNSTQVGSMRAAMHTVRDSVRQPGGSFDCDPVLVPVGDAEQTVLYFQREMSRCAAIERDPAEMRRLLALGRETLDTVGPVRTDDPQLIPRLLLKDLLLTQQGVLSAMIYAAEHEEPGVLITRGTQNHFRPARPLPDRELWFERVWQEYREKTER